MFRMADNPLYSAKISRYNCASLLGSMQRHVKYGFFFAVLGGLGFAILAVYNTLFGWWLDPLSQKGKDKALESDVMANIPFIASEGEFIGSHPLKPLPFDYASVKVHWRNLLVTVSRGRGETNISVAPWAHPNDSYELGALIAALDGRHYSAAYVYGDMEAAAGLLRQHLATLDAAFSEEQYPLVRERI